MTEKFDTWTEKDLEEEIEQLEYDIELTYERILMLHNALILKRGVK